MKISNVNQPQTKNDIWQKRANKFQSFIDDRLKVFVTKSIHLLDLKSILY